ncbi:MAG: 16S rRNA (guanine(966)-N(2))-methyltransferase RsmD [Amoebophilaceae bacterium TMED152]|nr:16S rRNA (guanine(966)-N(2))-methyltransferase RsmD [Gammaproteobacteria bacterium]RPH02021.1 MAG: 16S rRNA (guanine(966)-N(2))-methyltransferase RsmD [Amoebophilaceae bacterium TMED152]|tara:strand:- start:8852 stop:9415 length:564 start_codon:yes stop_codon:yes gene_type:complete
MPNIRIISGKIGGRNLKTSDNKNLRPTPAKMREQLFSWLRPAIDDLMCLDLFAGSGALGLEALSNGAKNVTFVEQNQDIYNCLKKNCLELNLLEEVKLHRQSAENYIRRVKDIKFDLIFLDPPYNKDYINTLLPKIIEKFVKNGAYIFIEMNSYDEEVYHEDMKLLKEASSGDSTGRLYQIKNENSD